MILPHFLLRATFSAAVTGVLAGSQLPVSMKRIPLIDGHNDFPIWIRAYYSNHIYQSNFSSEIELFGQVDFPRLRRGGLTAQFWSVYVECPRPDTGYEDQAYHEIIHDTLQQIDLVHRLAEEYPGALQFATSARDIATPDEISGNTPILSLMGIEGLHQIGNSASVMRMYHRLGVRYATLTHTCHNKYADSEEPETPLNHGLSPAGVELMAEFNRVGMMIDISHTSFNTQRDVLKHSAAPVIYSHSSAYTICPHSRNVPDDILMQLKANDGVIMVTFYPEYTNCRNKSLASLADVADHIQYIGDLIGFRHVGIGSDFDGMPHGPRGLEDVSKYPMLLAELSRRSISARAIEMVAAGNILRVMKKVEQVAHSLADQKPLEDDVKPFF